MVIQHRADPVLKFSRLTNSISKRIKKTSDIEEVEQAGVRNFFFAGLVRCLGFAIRSNLVQQELTRLDNNSIALLNKTMNIAPDVMQKLQDLGDCIKQDTLI